jgi:predicted nucleic acid-binding protein
VSKPVVIYDACVLYPAPLRDLLMRLAMADLFQARWTEQIKTEWVRNALANRKDLDAKRLARTCKLMDAAVPDCLVTGYEPIIDAVTLPDPNDRHVLAAAIHAGASMIVTFNRKDFPARCLHRYRIEAVHPDDFIILQIERSHSTVCEVVKRHRAALKHPPKTVEEYLCTLQQQRLTKTVAELRQYSGTI